MPEGKIITLDEILKNEAPQSQYRNVSEILNMPIIVTGVDFETRDIGEMVIIHTTTGDYYSFSRVLVNQFKQIKAYMEQHPKIGGINVVIRKKKRYYYLDKPE